MFFSVYLSGKKNKDIHRDSLTSKRKILLNREA